MRTSDKAELLQPLADHLFKLGYHVYLSSGKDYGFFTDQTGDRVCSFQVDFYSVKFSGNYATDNMRSTGTGWRIAPDLLVNDLVTHNAEYFWKMLTATAPHWAVGNAKVKYSTLRDHLRQYGRSSGYAEYMGSNQSCD